MPGPSQDAQWGSSWASQEKAFTDFTDVCPNVTKWQNLEIEHSTRAYSCFNPRKTKQMTQWRLHICIVLVNILEIWCDHFLGSLFHCCPVRYKMISEFTWPNHDLPSDKEAVKRLLQGCGFEHDVAYGKTKVFIRTPRTIFSLEEQRAHMVQRIVLFLQKVRM